MPEPPKPEPPKPEPPKPEPPRLELPAPEPQPKVQEIPPAPKYSERVGIAKRQFYLAAEDRGEKVACLEARKHLAWYLKGMPHAAFFRERVMSVATLRDIENVSRDILDALREVES